MNVILNVEKRESGKKSDRKNLRKNGFIPAVIIGDGNEGINISLEEGEFLKAFKHNFSVVTFYEMTVNGEKFKTIVKEYQIHPVTRKIIHVDFLALKEDKKVEIKVPLEFSGEPVGLKKGGRLETLVRSVKIECLPGDAPETLKVDISKLNLAQKISISDLKVENIKILDNPMTSLAVVHAPRGMTSSEVQAALQD
ncbi:MAG: 50S ribosomal protein L25 [Candidatus Cloacimonadota bacterium]|nr:MAG: 50S ribosomal protein L25 [Candidatus Cloacimonadota bacterium]